ncbi:MAG TPA: hypothetical protein VKR32_10635 [Puia sp.]|nr:hypothetical protein [Puia sp.]
MNTRFLFPHACKAIGFVLAIPAFILMIFNIHYGFEFPFLEYHAKADHISLDNGLLFNIQSNNFTDELGGVTLIIGLLLIAFSRERQEDERIQKLRLESLLWAVYVNSIFLIISIIFFYGNVFLNIMAYNICTPLILFIARFTLLMYREERSLKNDNL